MNIPFDGSDLRAIAEHLESVEQAFADNVVNADMTGRIEVLRPDSGEVVGHIVPHDDWLGFEPRPMSWQFLTKGIN